MPAAAITLDVAAQLMPFQLFASPFSPADTASLPLFAAADIDYWLLIIYFITPLLIIDISLLIISLIRILSLHWLDYIYYIIFISLAFITPFSLFHFLSLLLLIFISSIIAIIISFHIIDISVSYIIFDARF